MNPVHNAENIACPHCGTSQEMKPVRTQSFMPEIGGSRRVFARIIRCEECSYLFSSIDVEDSCVACGQ